MQNLWTRTFSRGAAALALLLILPAGALAEDKKPERQPLPKPHPDLPEAYKQLMPRGGIPSVDAPQFVPAGAAEISEDAWVLGVVVEGQPRAYSLNLLNRHEVVNDRVGETAFAAVW